MIKKLEMNFFKEVISMVGRIVGLVFCLMCAVPFLIISVTNKDSKEPINFWSGDTTLKSKVKNVAEYNNKMAALILNRPLSSRQMKKRKSGHEGLVPESKGSQAL